MDTEMRKTWRRGYARSAHDDRVKATATTSCSPVRVRSSFVPPSYRSDEMCPVFWCVCESRIKYSTNLMHFTRTFRTHACRRLPGYSPCFLGGQTTTG